MEIKAPKEVALLPPQLRYTPQVMSDVITERRSISLAPVEAAQSYTRTGTNQMTWNIVSHQHVSQLLDPASIYFTCKARFKGGFPAEGFATLFSEVIVSSQGKVLERIRNHEYISQFIECYMQSRPNKRKRMREGFNKYEDRTLQKINVLNPAGVADAAAAQAAGQADHGYILASLDDYSANGFVHDSEMWRNVGYHYDSVNRTDPRHPAINDNADGEFCLFRFKIRASGILSQSKMIPTYACPISISLRLADPQRVSDTGMTAYEIQEPRMHMQMCTISQSFQNAMSARMRSSGLVLNYSGWDTFFQVCTQAAHQIVCPSNKQRVKAVWVLLLNEAYQNNSSVDNGGCAFRSCIQGTGVGGVKVGRTRGAGGTSLVSELNGTDQVAMWDQCPGVRSYQFQVGTELSEAITVDDRTGKVCDPISNTGGAFLEQFLRCAGAVNGHEAKMDYWGSELDPRMKPHTGADLLETFLSRYFVMCYQGSKLLGEDRIETAVDTSKGTDIVLDLRCSAALNAAAGHASVQCGSGKRVMFLVEYYAQLVIRDGDVSVAY